MAANQRINLLVLGVHFETAPIWVREQLSFMLAQISDALQGLQSLDGILEAAIISTCNRVEIYASVEDEKAAPEQIISFIAKYHAVPPDTFRSYLYCHVGQEAVSHLFSVTAGLHSMMLGEAQIQGQVKYAFEQAQNQSTAGRLLSQLFQNALTVGKRVRRETAIAKGCVSVSQAAVELIMRSVNDTKSLNVLLVGTGKMSMLAGKGLRKHGIRDLVIVNRTPQHAVALAEDLGAKALGFERLRTALLRADVVLTCTGSQDIILSFDLMQTIVKSRSACPLLLIDIAVPRDIASEVGGLPNVTLFNIDHLKTTVGATKKRKQKEVRAAKRIVAEEVSKFQSWHESLQMKPLISDLKRHAEHIRCQELERSLRRLEAVLSERDAALLDDLTNRIVNKILHRPLVRLKEEAAEGNGSTYTTTVRELFALE